MNTKQKNPIDPRTTRRRISLREWNWNRAMYATYEEVGIEPNATGLQVGWVIIQKKPEYLNKEKAS